MTTMTEPTCEQLGNFAAVRCFGAAATPLQRRVATELIEMSPTMREAWLEHHHAFIAELRRDRATSPSRSASD